MDKRLMIIGLDAAPPKLIYREYKDQLPNISRLIDEGSKAEMRSTHPPITIPAWMVMFTGKTPGELGIYGFRHRKPGDVKSSYIVNSTMIKFPTIWEMLSREGRRVAAVGIPPTFPPKPVNGIIISDFTTPGPEKSYTWPPWLKKELEARFGKYIFDITYRSEDKDSVANDLFEMIKQHLRIVEYLLQKKEWDFFAYVEIGVDRVHHAFWKYFDREHPRYTPHPRYSKVIPEFYKIVDEWVGRIKKELPKDAVIVIASDHGIKPMKGAFVMNQWLQEQGYLKLKEKPKKSGQDLDASMIDWSSTTAWAWGGYYSRIFVNLRGREPKGIIRKEEYENLLNQLKEDISKIKGPDGEPWKNIVHAPQEIYTEVTGDPPDLMAYLDNLSWRPAGTIGWDTLYLPENDRGPDDAEHDWNGVFLIYDPQATVSSGFKGELKIEEVFKKLRTLLQN